MNQTVVLLWLANIILDTGGQLIFKAAASHGESKDGFEHWKHMAAKPWIWLGVLCYVAEFFVWMAFLAYVDLSVGIMLGCINIVVIMLAGRLWFRELLTPWRVAGILLITIGVAVVGLGE